MQVSRLCQANDVTLAKQDRLPYFFFVKENSVTLLYMYKHHGSCSRNVLMVTVFTWKCVIEQFHSLVGNGLFSFEELLYF